MNSDSRSYLEIRDDTVEKGPKDPELGDEKEIVARGAYAHIERMSDGCVWLGLQVGRRFLHINFYARRKGVVIMNVEEEDHPPIRNVARGRG